MSSIQSLSTHPPHDVPPAYSAALSPYLKIRLDFGPSFYFIYHYQRNCYVYVEKTIATILQYPASALLNNTSQFFLSRMHPDDVPQHSHITGQWQSFYFSIPPADRHLYSISFDFRVRKKSGRYVRLLQQLVHLVHDDDGNVLYSLEKCTNISHWQKPKEVLLNVVGPSGKRSATYRAKAKLPEKEKIRFTRTELKVLKLLTKGLTSSQIAHELHVSVNTVNTHRRNMRHKSDVKSVAGLIKVAREQNDL